MSVKYRNSQIIKITTKKKIYSIKSIKWGISIEQKIYEDLQYPTENVVFH